MIYNSAFLVKVLMIFIILKIIDYFKAKYLAHKITEEIRIPCCLLIAKSMIRTLQLVRFWFKCKIVK